LSSRESLPGLCSMPTMYPVVHMRQGLGPLVGCGLCINWFHVTEKGMLVGFLEC
jgi:hypothetical protein